ncbi:MAG: protoheme IX farnesyltransferase [Chitinophagaceae bacterium]|nr:protoheme IX farnesyltransferase [Chitinophagaceae bacterium]MBK9569962.1 protoheme IX farnesyltransferase [Chitinophagaceae bacterium]MBL0130880.1 protoheme IX farnesyltransferase [Chitinophagaceae bacterium]MBL0272821.1 protoheme IX farnesyltransferase [Chitinophagaceae bacterium]
MKKIKDYLLLIKPSLSIMVVFSSVMSFALTKGSESYVSFWKMIFLLFAGGMLVTGSANAINQVVEKDTDARMKRTSRRPVAAGRMSVTEGWAFAIITGALGVFILGNYFNWLTAGLAAFSLFLYAFIYTPLKKVNSIAVLVGAVPGALPCLIGWAAGDNNLAVGGWVLFAFQFFWQFPHFWAIAWVSHKDYSSVGFKLLPADQGPTKFTAMQAIMYSVLMIPVTIAPYYIGMCNYHFTQGIISLVLIGLANLFMIGRCVTLYRKMDVGSARKVMFGSYMYLPVVMLALLLSKT